MSSDGSENTTTCSSPADQLSNNVPDSLGAIKQLISSQQEQTSASGNLALQYSPTPPTSIISDDDNDEVFTPIIANPTQNVPYIPNRHPHSPQLCQQLTPIPDPPDKPFPENRRQPDLFRPSDLPNTRTTSAYPLPSVSTVVEGLQKTNLHAYMENNAYVTGCLVCRKPYKQVIEETVAHYLHQTAQPVETVRDRVLKRNASTDGLQRSAFTFLPRGVSQVANRGGQIYTLN